MIRGLCFLLLILIGCASTLPIFTEDQAQAIAIRNPKTTFQTLSSGRQLYIDHCSGCHSLHIPSQFTEEQWKRIMQTMQVKAKLTDAEKELILNYLLIAGVK